MTSVKSLKKLPLFHPQLILSIASSVATVYVTNKESPFLAFKSFAKISNMFDNFSWTRGFFFHGMNFIVHPPERNSLISCWAGRENIFEKSPFSCVGRKSEIQMLFSLFERAPSQKTRIAQGQHGSKVPCPSQTCEVQAHLFNQSVWAFYHLFGLFITCSGFSSLVQANQPLNYKQYLFGPRHTKLWTFYHLIQARANY